MKREPLALACTSDVAGKVRGKACPQSEFDQQLRRGMGWTPTNVQITCFDAIAEADRKYRWPLRRPDEHPGLSQLGL